MRKILLLLPLLCLFKIGTSQYNNGAPSVVPPSPNAAALGKYVDQPVDMCNGLVKVEIPLYTIKSRSLQLPISLSYHSGGIKVDDKESWVGLGWTLNAGGVMNRAIIGRRDETGLLTHSYMNTLQVNQLTNGLDVFDYLETLAMGNMDNESDKYSYRANDISGTFQYTIGHDLVQIPLTDNKIIDNPGVSYTVIADNGTQYVFDVIENSYNEATGTGWEPTSFYLSKMISADGADTIYFDYVQGGGYTDNTASFNITQSDPFGSTLGTNFSPPLLGIVHHDGRILQKIRFEGGYIDFTTINSSRSISEMKVYAADNTLKQSVKLEYTTWSSRTMLSEVKMLNNNGDTVGKYDLTYNTTYTMPDYFTGVNQSNLYYGQDKWGYYNGVTTNTTFMTQGPPSSLYADRSISEAHAQAGILTEIKFPTGGKSKFTYESNVAALSTVGGLRIKKIETYADAATTPITKNYTYPYGYGGILAYLDAFQGYHYSLIEDIHSDIGNPLPTGWNNGFFQREVWASSPIFPMTFNTNTAFYADVTETTTQNGIPLGKTVYEFEPDSDESYNTNVNTPVGGGVILPRYPVYLINLGWSRGQLKKKTISRRESNGVFTPVRVEENIYDKYKSATYTTGLNVLKYVIPLLAQPGHGSNANIERSPYQFFDILVKTWSKKLKQIIVTDNANSTSLTSTTTLFYDAATASSNPHFNVTKSETATSKNDVVQKIFQYPADFAGNSVYDGMLLKNMKNIVVKEVEKINTVDSRGSFTHFGSNTGGISPNTFTMYLPSKVQKLYKGVGFQDELFFDNYDEKANLKQFHKTADMNTAYIWDYNQRYPIAEVKNAAQADIAYTSFEAEGTGGWTINPGSTIVKYNGGVTGVNTFSGALSKTLSTGNYIITLWSNPAGTVTVNGATGILLNANGPNDWKLYQWTLNNVSSITILAANIDEVRLYPQGAQMTTYTYNPLVGVTSTCDINNHISYYHYDEFNRLVLVRDENKKIIKKFCYNFYDQTENCNLYLNEEQSQSYRKVCTPGNLGNMVSYVVPAGRYIASTLAAANAQALDDIQKNGQAYANATGACITDPCNSGNCSAEGMKCIDGICEQGVLVGTFCTYDALQGTWTNVYHYEWSDRSWSGDFYRYNSDSSDCGE